MCSSRSYNVSSDNDNYFNNINIIVYIIYYMTMTTKLRYHACQRPFHNAFVIGLTSMTAIGWCAQSHAICRFVESD